MHITKHDVPVRIDAPGAKVRQARDFGRNICAEYFAMAAGTDLAPLLEGLRDDACDAAHWGYLLSGDVVVTYTDGTSERCVTGDLFYWPAGHSVRVDEDAEIILFSEQAEHTAVMEHIQGKLALA